MPEFPAAAVEEAPVAPSAAGLWEQADAWPIQCLIRPPELEPRIAARKNR